MSVYENHRSTYRCTKGDRLGYFAHRHREIEVILMLEGSSRAIVNGISYDLIGGDALVVFPNHLHEFISTEKEDYILMLIPANIYSDYSDAIEGHRPVDPIIKNCARNEKILSLAKICMESNDRYAYQCRKFLIGAILGMVLSEVKLIQVHTDKTSMERVLDYCENHFSENITLESISKELFLSKFYISRLFATQLGVSFTNYINSLRIEASVKLLTTTELPITEICFIAGFSSTRNFNRVFSERIGVTPKEYRESQMNVLGSYTEKMKRQKGR